MQTTSSFSKTTTDFLLDNLHRDLHLPRAVRHVQIRSDTARNCLKIRKSQSQYYPIVVDCARTTALQPLACPIDTHARARKSAAPQNSKVYENARNRTKTHLLAKRELAPRGVARRRRQLHVWLGRHSAGELRPPHCESNEAHCSNKRTGRYSIHHFD